MKLVKLNDKFYKHAYLPDGIHSWDKFLRSDWRECIFEIIDKFGDGYTIKPYDEYTNKQMVQAGFQSWWVFKCPKGWCEHIYEDSDIDRIFEETKF